jgi:hypothetical protein
MNIFLTKGDHSSLHLGHRGHDGHDETTLIRRGVEAKVKKSKSPAVLVRSIDYAEEVSCRASKTV